MLRGSETAVAHLQMAASVRTMTATITSQTNVAVVGHFSFAASKGMERVNVPSEG